jgi:hypothetical protein
MTFKGIVSYNSNNNTLNLPTSGVKGGDTYVVSSSRTGPNHGDYHAGDMIVAIRDQGAEEASYPSGVARYSDNLADTYGWYLVETGYDAVHESKLSVETRTFTAADTDQKADPIVKLTSHTGEALGSTRFTSASNNIEVNHTAAQDGVISFNLVWATF